MALTTLAQVKTQAGITGSTYDAALTAIIAGVDAFIKKYTGRRLEKEAGAVVPIDGTGAENIFVPDYPVANVTKLEKETSFNFFEDVDATTYKVDGDNGIITLNADSAEGHYNYRLTADVGYETVPEDLQQAATQLVIREFNQRSGGGEIESERLGEYAVTYKAESGADNTGVNANKDQFIDATLNAYRNIHVRLH